MWGKSIEDEGFGMYNFFYNNARRKDDNPEFEAARTASEGLEKRFRAFQTKAAPSIKGKYSKLVQWCDTNPDNLKTAIPRRSSEGYGFIMDKFLNYHAAKKDDTEFEAARTASLGLDERFQAFRASQEASKAALTFEKILVGGGGSGVAATPFNKPQRRVSQKHNKKAQQLKVAQSKNDP